MTTPKHWTRLAPGVYDDNEGGLHLVLPELLAGNGYADTPENRETLIAAMRDVWTDDRGEPAAFSIEE